MRRFGLALCIAVLTMVVAAPARAQTNPCPGVPGFDWQGRSVARQVTVQVGGGPAYAGTVLRPRGPLRTLGRMPGVVLMHGAGGSQCGLWWAARHLAGHGYVTLVLTHQGNLAGHEQAVRTGVRWLRSRSNPFRDLTLRNRIGLAGHSQGSNASMLAQDEPGVRALVALDSLKRFARGDRAAAIGCTGPRSACNAARARPRLCHGPAVRQPPGADRAGPEEDRPRTLEVGRPAHDDPGHARLRAQQLHVSWDRGAAPQRRTLPARVVRPLPTAGPVGHNADPGASSRRATDAAAPEHDLPLGGLPAREDRLRGLRELPVRDGNYVEKGRAKE